MNPDDPDYKGANAVGQLAWLIAQEFEQAFDDLFLDMVNPDEENPEKPKKPEKPKTRAAGGGS